MLSTPELMNCIVCTITDKLRCMHTLLKMDSTGCEWNNSFVFHLQLSSTRQLVKVMEVCKQALLVKMRNATTLANMSGRYLSLCFSSVCTRFWFQWTQNEFKQLDCHTIFVTNFMFI